MTHKEITEQSKRLLLLTGAKLFGSKGYDATSIYVIEKDLNQTRGAIAYHFKSKLGLFEETVNKYYLNRVMFSSVPEEYRGRLKDFYVKYVSMLEEECLEMMNGGIRNVAGTFLSLEADALRNLPDFRNKCTELKHRQASVLELVVGRAIQNGEIKSDIIPSVIADLFMNVVIGKNYRSNVEGSRYYTDGMLHQFNSIYRLISNQ